MDLLNRLVSCLLSRNISVGDVLNMTIHELIYWAERINEIAEAEQKALKK
jgi:hypothetical protein